MVVERLGVIAGEARLARAQMAWAWLRAHQLNDAAAALSVKLSADEIAALEQPYAPQPVLRFT